MTTKLPAVLPADFSTSLATAIAVGGTSFTTQSNVDDDGVTLNDGLVYITVDGTNSNKEHFQAIKTGASYASVYSVSRQGVLTSGAVRAHRIGATAVCTDYAVLKYLLDLVAGTTTFNASVPLGYDGAPTISTGNQLATKTYVDGVAVAGAPNADTTTKGIVEEATQAEVDAKTATGGTGAKLFQNLSTVRSTLLSDYVVDTGTADAYVITPSPAITAYTTGQIFTFKATNTNTTTSTINVNALGVKTIKKLNGATNLAAGDIVAGQLVQIQYDGTNFQMESPVGVAPVTSATLLSTLGIGGNGIDGTVVISGNTSLSRDMYYDNLTVNTGVTLNPNGFRIFVKGTLTTTGTGKIASNGNVGGTGATGGSTGVTAGGTAAAAAYTTGSLPIPLAGKTGGTGGDASGGNFQPGGNGVAGTDQAKSLGDTNAVAGGNGGEQGGGNGGDGGIAGAKTGTVLSQPQAFHPAYNLYDVVSGTVTVHGIAPSSGSGGGGTGGATNDGSGGGGGASGSSGGVVWISAKTITTLNVEALGGNGGQGGNGNTASKGGVGGGGGAGNGGTIVLIYGSGTGITTSVLGGTGGAIGSSGVQTNATAGANGNVGKVYTISLS